MKGHSIPTIPDGMNVIVWQTKSGHIGIYARPEATTSQITTAYAKAIELHGDHAEKAETP